MKEPFITEDGKKCDFSQNFKIEMGGKKKMQYFSAWSQSARIFSALFMFQWFPQSLIKCKRTVNVEFRMEIFLNEGNHQCCLMLSLSLLSSL